PGAERGPLLEAGEAAPGGQQRFLDDVLGVLHGAEDPVAVHVQLAPVRGDELGECSLVAGLGPLDQLRCHADILASPRRPTFSRPDVDTAPGENWALLDRPIRGQGGVHLSKRLEERTDMPHLLPKPLRVRRPPSKGWTLVLTSLGLFMVALDTLVVTTALPVIRVARGASLSDLEWTVNIYNLAFACLLLTGAALGDRFGRRRMFAIGLSVFTAASAAAALSPGVGALIAARAVQGAGAALVMPLTLTLISAAFPTEKRGAAIGLWGGIPGPAAPPRPVVRP